jgi:hypothetical protein
MRDRSICSHHHRADNGLARKSITNSGKPGEHDMNIGGEHVIVRSQASVPPGDRRLGVRVRRLAETVPPTSEFTLLIDGIPADRIQSQLGFFNFVSWNGLDIGRDRGSPVSHYQSQFTFTDKLIKVTVTMDDDQVLDGDGVCRELARE